MIDRRKLFTIMTTAGISAITSDAVVAEFSGDTDYLKDRAERLAAHVSRLDREDAERAAYSIVAKREADIVQKYVDLAHDRMINNNMQPIEVSREGYRLLLSRNLIDYLPNEKGDLMVAIFYDRRIKLVQASH